MVTDEEDFVRADLLALSQLGLDDSGGAERVAVAFARRFRVPGRDDRAIGFANLRPTRGG